MTGRTRKMNPAEVHVRAQHARAFLEAADLVGEFGHDAGIPQIGNTIGSLAVLAGIAAGDAICGSVLGMRSSAEGHATAVELLRTTEPGRNLAPHLRRLINSKTETQYAPALLTEARASDLVKAARRLVAGMDDVLRNEA